MLPLVMWPLESQKPHNARLGGTAPGTSVAAAGTDKLSLGRPCDVAQTVRGAQSGRGEGCVREGQAEQNWHATQGNFQERARLSRSCPGRARHEG